MATSDPGDEAAPGPVAEQSEMRAGRGAGTRLDRRRSVHRQPPRWRLLPGVRLPRYDIRWLPHDVLAGLVLTTILVPTGMAYAEAAGLPPVTGLYATCAALVGYALLGPSPLLVLGPDSALAPLIALSIAPLAQGDPARAVALASALAIMSGLLCIALGLARFGFLTDLLSLPIRYGYLNGIALVVLVGQLPKLFGFSANGNGLIGELTAFLRGLASGNTNVIALALGAAALGVILALRRVAPSFPAMAVAVAGTIVAVVAFHLDRHGVPLVGSLPRVPIVTLPGVRTGEVTSLLAAALGIALVSFADMSVLSRTFAMHSGREMDANQELVALGAANVVSGLLQGFSVTSSASRTPVAEAAGARTQLAGVTSAVVILAVLAFSPSILRNLPSAALAAVVIAAALRILEFRGVVRLARVRPSEFFLSVAALLGVALFGVIRGIGLAVAIALGHFVRRAWRPHTTELVRVPGLKGYHDVERHPEGSRIPGLVLYRFDAPLFFANAELFEEEVVGLASRRDPASRWVVVTAEPITDVDATAAEMLLELVRDLNEHGVTLAFAELKGHVRDRLRSYGLVDKIGSDHFFRTVGEAVRAYVAAEAVEWVDWQDQPGASEG